MSYEDELIDSLCYSDEQMKEYIESCKQERDEKMLEAAGDNRLLLNRAIEELINSDKFDDLIKLGLVESKEIVGDAFIKTLEDIFLKIVTEDR